LPGGGKVSKVPLLTALLLIVASGHTVNGEWQPRQPVGAMLMLWCCDRVSLLSCYRFDFVGFTAVYLTSDPNPISQLRNMKSEMVSEMVDLTHARS